MMTFNKQEKINSCLGELRPGDIFAFVKANGFENSMYIKTDEGSFVDLSDGTVFEDLPRKNDEVIVTKTANLTYSF